MKAAAFLFILISGFLTPGMMRSALAQVTSDGTTNTIVNQNGNNFNILNGIEKGNNLFHSFSNFSIPVGGAASFDLGNTPNITTIFSRVTGGNVSDINGLIRTLNGNNPVSLFLMNPAGIVFGKNASLNIGGSFVGTTANSIKFADGTEFNAANPSSPPLLTMSVPIGLQMGQNPGTIAIQNVGHAIQFTPFTPLDTRTSPPGLQVSPGQTLALIGNGLSATGGILSSVSGNIQLGSVQDGLIRFNPTLPGWGFDYAGVQNFADIDLSQKSLVNVSSFGEGSIQFHGQNIRLTEGSVALHKNFGSQPGGQISINATGKFELGGITPKGSPASEISSETLRVGAGANIQVTARQLSFQNGGRLNAFTFGAGQSGSITVNATDSIEINGFLPASPITSSLIGGGNSGFGATGNSGSIHITTAHLRLLNSGSVSSATFGTGAAGDVQVDATESIELIGVNPITLAPSVITTGSFNAGNAGNLTINTARLSLKQGAAIGSSSPATGKAGNISIRASESILVSDLAPGSISSSRIASVSEILDQVTQSVFRLPPIPQSNSGSVTIATPLLQVQNGGRLTVKNEGTGNAGQLSIQANTLRLENGFIEGKTASGQGGNINLQVQDILLLKHGSEITTTSGNTGDGGNITIYSPVILALENSDIIANAVQGRGGNINITTQGIIGLEFRNTLTPRTDPTNDITASSQFNVNGTVQINNIGVDPNSGLVELPTNVTDPSQQIASGCSASQGSSFVATGRGGIPQNPTQEVRSERAWSDIRNLTAYRKTSYKTVEIPASSEVLVQATGWQLNPQGQVELIADKPPVQVQQTLTCAAFPKS